MYVPACAYVVYLSINARAVAVASALRAARATSFPTCLSLPATLHLLDGFGLGPDGGFGRQGAAEAGGPRADPAINS